jgi:hypothetical protein
MLVNEKKDVYVNPQMETNSIWKRGFPVWEYPSVPAHFCTGTPHMEMGSVVLATSKSRVEEPHRFHMAITIWKQG